MVVQYGGGDGQEVLVGFGKLSCTGFVDCVELIVECGCKFGLALSLPWLNDKI